MCTIVHTLGLPAPPTFGVGYARAVRFRDDEDLYLRQPYKALAAVGSIAAFVAAVLILGYLAFALVWYTPGYGAAILVVLVLAGLAKLIFLWEGRD